MTTSPVSPKAVSVNAPDVSLGPPDKVLITHSNLANALVQNQTEALQLLNSEVGPVKIEEISIDSEGRIVIDNLTFAQSLRDKLNKAVPLSGLGGSTTPTNTGICGAYCKPSTEEQ